MRMIFTLLLVISVNAFAECVHEVQMTLDQITSLKATTQKAFVEINGRFVDIEKAKGLKSGKVYTVQFAHNSKELKGYDDTFLKYYRYERINQFLSENQGLFAQRGYKVEVVGQSVEGRNLYGVFPQNVSSTKKTIIMFGRHHGDEGTANWIIEGFVKKLFGSNNKAWFDNYQLLLYPMVNPDGAEARSRYNSNGRDLNRSWATTASREHDEVIHIHNHIRKFWSQVYPNLFIVLDMHGSFTEDFIYRVGTSFRDRNFYDLQQEFIDELSTKDEWQAGNFKVSSGAPTMSRIVMVKHYGVNALTHETPRDIKINNSRGRSIRTLEEQGEDIVATIKTLY